MKSKHRTRWANNNSARHKFPRHTDGLMQNSNPIAYALDLPSSL